MASPPIGRREFIGKSLAGAAAAILGASGAAAQARRTAVDRVPLGKTPIKITRLGIGTGTNGGRIQRTLGEEGLAALIRHAYDRGVRYIDTAPNYVCFEYMRRALKDLPREELVILSKVSWSDPKGVAPQIENIRKTLGIDTLDIALLHGVTKPDWAADLARLRDELSDAKSKGLIRAHGLSVHSIQTLREVPAASAWVDVALCRINHTGQYMDGYKGEWKEPGEHADAVAGIRKVREAGIGILGMKICANGDFKDAEEREKSIQFVWKSGLVDATVIGFKSPAEVDEAIERIGRALNA
jgi:aryl-alcohol dehydrogenase-like predicted oxidoreductase